MSILTKTSTTEWLKFFLKNHMQILWDNLSFCSKVECIITVCLKLQGHTFCAHTAMERNLRNNGDLKAA